MYTIPARLWAVTVLRAMTVPSLLVCSNQSTQAASSSTDSRSVATIPSSPTVTALNPSLTATQPTTNPSPSLQLADQAAGRSNPQPRAVVDQ